MKLKYTAILLVCSFSAIRCYANLQNGSEEIIQMVKAFNKRLEKKSPDDGMFVVMQNKDNGQIISYDVSYFTYKRDKKLHYQLDETIDSGHFAASVAENGSMLRITYHSSGGAATYSVKMVDNELRVFDEGGKVIFPARGNSAEKPAPTQDAEDIHTTADVKPKPAFDYGAYLGDNLHYPENARLHNIEGKVMVKFVINEDGSISDVQLLKGIDDDCDNEALRVVRNMPKWIPGKVKGKIVKIYFTIPVIFKLTD